VLYVVEYNESLLDEAGVTYPELDWTYDDFLARAVALTEGEGGQYGFVPGVDEYYALPLILEGLGAELVDTGANPPALSFDTASTITALRRYTDLALVHRVQPILTVDLGEVGMEEVAERLVLIQGGPAAMWMLSSWESAHLDRLEQREVGIAPLPGEGTSGWAGVMGYFISAGAESPQACWEWIKFVSGEAETVGVGLPARKSVAESEAYRLQVGEERAAAYLAAMADAERSSYVQATARQPWLRGTEYWLFRAYVQVVEGEASVQAALSEIQSLADDYRACVIAHEALFDQAGWEGCLREVDPTLPEVLFGSGE